MALTDVQKAALEVNIKQQSPSVVLNDAVENAKFDNIEYIIDKFGTNVRAIGLLDVDAALKRAVSFNQLESIKHILCKYNMKDGNIIDTLDIPGMIYSVATSQDMDKNDILVYLLTSYGRKIDFERCTYIVTAIGKYAYFASLGKADKKLRQLIVACIDTESEALVRGLDGHPINMINVNDVEKNAFKQRIRQMVDEVKAINNTATALAKMLIQRKEGSAILKKTQDKRGAVKQLNELSHKVNEAMKSQFKLGGQ